MYKKISQVVGLRYEEVPLQDNFSLDIKLMLEKIRRFESSYHISCLSQITQQEIFGSKDDIEAIIKQSNGVVVVDEAYGAFSGESLYQKWMNLKIL